MNAEKISYLPNIQRLLPQSADAEQGLLSSFLLSPMTVGALCAERRIAVAHFHVPGHAMIFAEMLDKWTTGDPIDFITLTQSLRDKGLIDAVGGASFVTGLFSYLPTAANAEHYAEILEEKRGLRDLIAICSEFVERGHTEQDDARGLVESAATKICAIGSAGQTSSKPKTPKEMAMEACERAEDRIDKRGLADFTMKTGLPKIDEGMSGIRPGDYILISGKEKSGKTSLAFNILEHVVFVQRKNALAVSLEMKLPEITDRMISSLGRINFTNILNGWMNAGEMDKFQVASTTLGKGKFQIRDDVQSLAQIVAVFRQYKAANPDLELGVVDYLQLIDADKGGGGREDKREQVISHISRTMRRLASELNIGMLMLVQLNEDGQVRESRAPGMDCTAHIRIEPGSEDGLKWARIVYQRNGPSNVAIPLAHLGCFIRFEPGTQVEQEPKENPRKKKWNQD